MITYVVDRAHSVVYGVGSIKRLGTNKEIVAIFADSGRLYFQIGKNNWDISKFGLTFISKRIPAFFGLLREFLVLDSSQRPLFKTLYFDRYIFSWKNWIDITYDEFDRQLDDIYLWLSTEANDSKWKAELLARWTKGLTVPH
jgi:hypothetical protein